MSKLEIRIQNAIQNQLEVIHKMTKLREELQASEIAYSNTVGKLSVLSELYQEETGRALQDDLDNDPSWKERVASIQKRVKEGGDPPTQLASVPPPAPEPAKVEENKVDPSLARRRQPASITVDDNPPGPGADED